MKTISKLLSKDICACKVAVCVNGFNGRIAMIKGMVVARTRAIISCDTNEKNAILLERDRINGLLKNI